MKPQLKITYSFLVALLALMTFSQVRAQTISLNLSPSYYGIFNISGFGLQDGYIDLTVTGGVPPYIYKWSNGSDDEDIWGLAAGYYRVDVWDINSNHAQIEVTLTQPPINDIPYPPCDQPIPLPAWSTYTNPLTLWTCPTIDVVVGSYYGPPSGMKFSVFGNTYLGGKLGINAAGIPSNLTCLINGTTKFNGSVGIGTDPTTNNAGSYKLVVGGKLGAEEIWVATGAWPDYVFNKDYSLKSLDELEAFVNQEKHLPGLPSAEEVQNQEKINLGEMLTKILEKTEENTLYILELKKQNCLLREENKRLAKLIDK